MQEVEGQAILAYFKSPEEAQRCADRLKQELDIDDVQIDRFGRFAGSVTTERVMNPINADFSSHLSLVGGKRNATPEEGRALGADPSIYSMSDGDGMVTGRDIILTVVCEKTKVEQAVKVINECGGQH